MYLKCECGNVMNNVGHPNNVEHLLLDTYTQEKLESLVCKEVKTDGVINLWAEHWEDAGSIVVWKCGVCERLYFNATGELSSIKVYKVEKIGLSEN